MRGVLAVGALLWFAACSDPRCSVANCQVLHDCFLSFEDEPQEPQLCGDAGTKAALLTYCAQACDAQNVGAFLGCVATNFGSSCPLPDGGFPTENEILDACAPGIPDGGPACGPKCQACNNMCDSDNQLCNETCPDAGVCLDCEDQCSHLTESCLQTCPTN